MGTIMVFIVFDVEKMDMKQRHVGSYGRISKISMNKRKEKVKILDSLNLLLLIAILV
jgi:hypothetical protein